MYSPLRPSRSLLDFPQIVLTSYLLTKSLGDCLPEEAIADCLPEEAIAVPGVCKLTAKSAFMVVLSLVTSAAYLGCKPVS
jgi:hypothetical protein